MHNVMVNGTAISYRSATKYFLLRAKTGTSTRQDIVMESVCLCTHTRYAYASTFVLASRYWSRELHVTCQADVYTVI